MENLLNLLALAIFGFAIAVPIIMSATEFFKKVCKWSGTITSGILAVIVPSLIYTAYIIITEQAVTAPQIIVLIVLIYACFIGATEGYDKGLAFIKRLLSILKGNIPSDDDTNKTDTTDTAIGIGTGEKSDGN